MFKPIVGGLDHAPSPLQQLPQNIISTATITTPTTFPYLPPSQPSHPLRPQHHTRKTTNTTGAAKANKINPAANFILTDAEFPRSLSRDGPGSRFPSPLLGAPTIWTNSARRTREVPEVLITSPTETSRSVRTARSIHSSSATPHPSNHLATSSSNVGTRTSQPDDGRVYIPYSPAQREGVCCGEDIGSKDRREGLLRADKNGKGVVDGGRRFVAYRPSPAGAPPPPPSATPPCSWYATTAIKRNIDTLNDDHDDEDIIKQAVAMNLIYFHSRSPTPPPAPPSPSSTDIK
ncbi:MAG: hypothetical protein Q9180_009684, partial [Flavoplaca navasiana]